MATNPKLPPQHEHPKLALQPRSKVPWVLVAILVAAAILVALILWLPRTPRQRMSPSAAQVPAQPTGSQIQLTNLNLTPSTTGGAFTLQAQLTNQGTSEINGVMVDATFKSINGQNLETIRVPVMGVEGGSNTATEPLTSAPIKPNETRPVRMEFTHVPQGWNQQLPELKVVTVTAAGQPVSPAGEPPILNEQVNQNTQGKKNPTAPGQSNAGAMSPGGHASPGTGNEGTQPVKGRKPGTEPNQPH